MTILLTIFILTILTSAAIAGGSAAPWVPARKQDVERFLTAGGVKAGDMIYDLGCGDGRLVAGATKRGAEAYGFEISLFPYLLAKVRGLSLSKNKDKYHIKFQNFWKTPLQPANVIFLFLMPKVLIKMRDKIMAEAKPGTRIVSYVWPLPELTPVRVDKIEGFPVLYVYEK